MVVLLRSLAIAHRIKKNKYQKTQTMDHTPTLMFAEKK